MSALVKLIADIVTKGGTVAQDAALNDLCAAAHRYHTASAPAKQQRRAELALTAKMFADTLK